MYYLFQEPCKSNSLNRILLEAYPLCSSRYMFLFQVPVLPILMLRVFDLRRIAAAFCGKSMGAKTGTFTDEDIEAYKYTFAEYCKSHLHSIQFNS